MKNLFLLSTDKPSYLYKDMEVLFYNKDFVDIPMLRKNQNIYITNSEEIKEGDKSLLFVDGFEPMILTHFEPVKEGYEGKKIVLTTDAQLIADGVQAIDDTFLEWFVQNPSCENVEIINRYSDFTRTKFLDYKIIIPQEKPKQEIELIDGFIPTSFFEKQEKIEEVIKNELEFLHNSCRNFDFDLGFKTGVFIGANWQQENIPIKILDCDNIYAHVENGFVIIEKNDKYKKSYSQEEAGELVYNIIGEYAKHYGVMIDGAKLNELFEQFKKK
jgi:hypothetical protein